MYTCRGGAGKSKLLVYMVREQVPLKWFERICVDRSTCAEFKTAIGFQISCSITEI